MVLMFSADHQFSADVRRGAGFLEKSGKTQAGSWKIVHLGNDEDPGVEISFPTAEQPSLTPPSIRLVSHLDGDKLSMCLYAEPDKPCSGYLLHRTVPTTGRATGG
ncbi:hypothetical protein ACFVSN_13865 [Kitasatospora sp. NPDC057904]|uniref:hypothetical protein n=1 Tax=Kitasatospora sp. NPDC057904 TaxID=3346275 RepID=UPI0036DA0CCB